MFGFLLSCLIINISQFCQESSSKMHHGHFLGRSHKTWISWAGGISFAPWLVPDFCPCSFRFTTGRHRAHLRETDATLRKRSSLSRAARLTACCLGWSPSATTRWTSAWSTGKGRARPAPTESLTLQKEVGGGRDWDPRAYGSSWEALQDRRGPTKLA